MPIKLENVGIAVRDLEAMIVFFTDLGADSPRPRHGQRPSRSPPSMVVTRLRGCGDL